MVRAAEPRRWARTLLVAIAALLAVSLLGQVLIAGLAVFTGPVWWPRHREWVHFFEWLAPVALVLCYVARAPRGAKVCAWIIMALLWLQYTTIEQRLVPGHAHWAALHPVGGALLFWMACELARRSAA